MGTKIRMLVDNWTYRDYIAFVTAFRAGNTSETFRLAQKLIVSWDYSVDLNLKNAVMKLGVAESAEVVRTVMEVIGEYIDTLDVTGVEVDFKKWDTERFMKFEELNSNGKFDQSEKMLSEVIKWDKLEQATYPLSFSVMATILKAIREEYTRLVTGKN